jgi:hypothetical protein
MAVKRFMRSVSTPFIISTVGFSISICDAVEKEEFAKPSRQHNLWTLWKEYTLVVFQLASRRDNIPGVVDMKLIAV